MDLPDKMHAMVLEKPGELLSYKSVSVPKPGGSQILIKIHACGVCRTDLHILHGELKNAKLPWITGHEIVGTVVTVGIKSNVLQPGMPVGVPWLGYTCGDYSPRVGSTSQHP